MVVPSLCLAPMGAEELQEPGCFCSGMGTPQGFMAKLQSPAVAWALLRCNGTAHSTGSALGWLPRQAGRILHHRAQPRRHQQGISLQRSPTSRGQPKWAEIARFWSGCKVLQTTRLCQLPATNPKVVLSFPECSKQKTNPKAIFFISVFAPTGSTPESVNYTQECENRAAAPNAHQTRTSRSRWPFYT